MLASKIVWDDKTSEETADEIRAAFSIANSWRDSHAFPMKSIRHSVLHLMQQSGIKGESGARLKRMQAIRGKLRRLKFSLNQLQDLGGCRIILESMADVKTLVELIRNKSIHEIKREDNYILEPKSDGYRSHHIIFSFIGSGDSASFSGRRIELQVRTRLQHAWATGVEAVGLFRGENLKNHIGSPEWLRLFELLSAEFAETEGCPMPPGCLTKAERVKEITRLEKRLDALKLLESIKRGVIGTDNPIAPGYKPSHYLIRYNHITNTVSVETYSDPLAAAQSYDNAEAKENRTEDGSETIVLVEVDKIENLKSAYPNYFGDVEYLKSQLRLITKGKSAIEYAAAPRAPPPKPHGPYGDLSWLRRSSILSPRGGRQKKGDRE